MRTPLNNLLRDFKNYLSLSLCTYIPRMNAMLDFICMGQVELPGAHRKRQNTKWKIPCPQWDWNDLIPTCTPETNVYIIIHVITRMIKDSVFCLVNVLFCVTYWNIYKCCTNSKETHKSCACLQHANTAKHPTWSGICTLKASTGPMRLFVICKMYIYSNM